MYLYINAFDKMYILYLCNRCVCCKGFLKRRVRLIHTISSSLSFSSSLRTMSATAGPGDQKCIAVLILFSDSVNVNTKWRFVAHRWLFSAMEVCHIIFQCVLMIALPFPLVTRRPINIANWHGEGKENNLLSYNE